jgi:hypothetical protein
VRLIQTPLDTQAAQASAEAGRPSWTPTYLKSGRIRYKRLVSSMPESDDERQERLTNAAQRAFEVLAQGSYNQDMKDAFVRAKGTCRTLSPTSRYSAARWSDIRRCAHSTCSCRQHKGHQFSAMARAQDCNTKHEGESSADRVAIRMNARACRRFETRQRRHLQS